ncbi:FHA domain-containing protein FhaB/FipA [Propionibacteriaceae bacterium Y1923]|uniref:FHA domain-containing protein FhaB/FipA n=1 Tax=Aestuariimicrobium sp. Y1814 TaxID=3418742 RepID=UPI003C180F2F
MSELIVGALKLAFLAMMWAFILFAANIIRTDMFGRQVATSPDTALEHPAKPRKKRRSRHAPTSLVVIEGRQAGLSIPLAGVVGLGRAADSALNIDDDYASTRHAQITMDDNGQWWLEDLNSTNGTSVNTVRVSAPVQVQTGDTIRIGRTVMRLERP